MPLKGRKEQTISKQEFAPILSLGCPGQTYALPGEMPDFLFREEPDTQTAYEVLHSPFGCRSENEVGTDESPWNIKWLARTKGTVTRTSFCAAEVTRFEDSTAKRAAFRKISACSAGERESSAFSTSAEYEIAVRSQ